MCRSHAMRTATVRDQLVLVTQEVHVFAGQPRRRPAARASADATDDEVTAALEAVGAAAWVAELPDGSATEVGAGGHALDCGPVAAGGARPGGARRPADRDPRRGHRRGGQRRCRRARRRHRPGRRRPDGRDRRPPADAGGRRRPRARDGRRRGSSRTARTPNCWRRVASTPGCGRRGAVLVADHATERRV